MEDKETNRLEAFSDGVFAVAITLLVLNIKPPPDTVLTSAAWWSALLNQLPALIAFVTSFATIDIMWTFTRLGKRIISSHGYIREFCPLAMSSTCLAVACFLPCFASSISSSKQTFIASRGKPLV